MSSSMLLPFDDFASATRVALAELRSRHGMALWMFTRTVDDDWVVLEAEDHGYGVERGRVFRWSESFCIRMVAGEAPQAAPRAGEVAAYAAAPISQQMPIGAYVGVPLLDDQGRLFGTLCAIDPLPRVGSLEPVVADAELTGRLLMTVMSMERRLRVEQARTEQARSEARIDQLTGVPNRRGWDDLLGREESRCARYGDPAGVIVIDLDDLKTANDNHGHAAGDELLKLTAQTLVASVRTLDVVARLGGDEFGVLASGTSSGELERLAHRIDAALAKVGVRASMGWARRDPRTGFAFAQLDADAAMYETKRRRQSAPQGATSAGL
jgi:diguanylate cyclase (GGDEF)-like protein